MENQSPDIKDLVTALAKAQGQMRPAVFNKVNPHFKNRYADFNAIIDSCREPLASNGLSVMQYCEYVGDKLMLVTQLCHTSGQWIKSYFPMNPESTKSQALGSALSYSKRYALSALLTIVSDDEDDDAEECRKVTDFITGSQIDDLEIELQDMEDFKGTILRGLRIDKLSEIPRSKYDAIVKKIKEIRKERGNE